MFTKWGYELDFAAFPTWRQCTLSPQTTNIIEEVLLDHIVAVKTWRASVPHLGRPLKSLIPRTLMSNKRASDIGI